MILYLIGALLWLGSVQAYFLLAERERTLVRNARHDWQSLVVVVLICLAWPVGALLNLRAHIKDKGERHVFL
jgi:hypothetical protein